MGCQAWWGSVPETCGLSQIHYLCDELIYTYDIRYRYKIHIYIYIYIYIHNLYICSPILITSYSYRNFMACQPSPGNLYGTPAPRLRKAVRWSSGNGRCALKVDEAGRGRLWLLSFLLPWGHGRRIRIWILPSGNEKCHMAGKCSNSGF